MSTGIYAKPISADSHSGVDSTTHWTISTSLNVNVFDKINKRKYSEEMSIPVKWKVTKTKYKYGGKYYDIGTEKITGVGVNILPLPVPPWERPLVLVASYLAIQKKGEFVESLEVDLYSIMPPTPSYIDPLSVPPVAAFINFRIGTLVGPDDKYFIKEKKWYIAPGGTTDYLITVS